MKNLQITYQHFSTSFDIKRAIGLGYNQLKSWIWGRIWIIKVVDSMRGDDCLTIEVIQEKVLEIIDDYPIKKVVLFGSRATGTNREDSDVDLIMEFFTPITLLMLSQIRYQLEKVLGLRVDVIHGPIRDTDLLDIGEVVELYAA